LIIKKAFHSLRHNLQPSPPACEHKFQPGARIVPVKK
jgi:hypothetical protein